MKGLFIIGTILFFLIHVNAQPSRIPRLGKNRNYTQLIVDGKPFLIFGGELGNSTASSNEYMRPICDGYLESGDPSPWTRCTFD